MPENDPFAAYQLPKESDPFAAYQSPAGQRKEAQDWRTMLAHSYADDPNATNKLRAMRQGLTLGWGDEIQSALGAVKDAVTNGSSIPEAYKKRVAADRAAMAQYAKDSPGQNAAYNLLGGLPTMFLPAGAVGTAARTLPQLMKAGAAVGAGYGAVAGAGDAPSSIGNTVAGAAGGAVTGGLLGAGIPPAVAGVSKVSGAVAGLLKDSALDQYARVFAARSGADQAKAARFVPELLDRGLIAGSKQGLSDKLSRMREKAGQEIEDIWSNIPAGTKIPLENVLGPMDQSAANSFRSEGGRYLSKQSERGDGIVDDLKQRLLDESGYVPATPARTEPTGRLDSSGNSITHTIPAVPQQGGTEIDASALRRYRQEWDRIANQGNAFTASVDDATNAGAHRIGGDAARGSINDMFPNMKAANKEYGLFKDASDVYGNTLQRKQGQAKSLGRTIMSAVGTGAGLGVGGIHGAIAGRAALEGIEAGSTTVPYNTMMAIFKDRLAKAAAAGVPIPRGMLLPAYAGKFGAGLLDQ